jgi:hypothetical protein
MRFSSYFSKYDEETNRCYVMIMTRISKENVVHLTLYDGQGGGMIAMWAGNTSFIKGEQVSPPAAYEYIQKMMKDDMGGK